MVRLAAKLLIVALALSVAPLHASSVRPAAPTGAAGVSPAEALANLPAPLPEETFFELINATGTPGYVAGSQDLETQIMVIILSILLSGDSSVATPEGIPTDVFHLDSFFGGFTLMDVSDAPAPPAGGGNLAAGGRGARSGAAAVGRGVSAGAAAATRGGASGSGAARGNNPSNAAPSGSGVPASGSVSAATGGNYRIDVGGLPTDNVTDASWTRDGRLQLTIPMIDWYEWSEWYETKLRSGGNFDDGITGKLSFLSPDHTTETGAIDFFGMVPVSLQVLPAQDGKLRRFVVTLDAKDVRRTGNTTAAPTNPDHAFIFREWNSLSPTAGDRADNPLPTAPVELPYELFRDDTGHGDSSLFEFDRFSACTLDPSTPNCGAAGGVFANSSDLLNSCAVEDSPVCTQMLDGSPPAAGTYYIFVDGFGAATDEGLYRLTLSEDVVLTCDAEPDTPGCAEAAALLSSLSAYDSGCDADPSPACIDEALPEGIPESFLIGDDFDWYSFTLDNPPAFILETLPVSADDAAFDTEVWLYDLDDFAACGADPATPNCSAAGAVFTSMSGLLGVCSAADSAPCDLFSAIGPELLEAGSYLIRVEYASDDTTGPYTLAIDVDQVAACVPDSDVPGCSELVDLVGGLYAFNSGCDADPSAVCNESALASDENDEQLSYLWGLVGGSTTTAPRTVIVSPGSSPGHIGFRETGDSTGIFRVTEEELYTFEPNNPDMLSSAFAGLPEGSAIATDRYIIRPAPGGGSKYLFRDGSGKVYLLDGSELGPPSGGYPLTELTVDESASNDARTILTGPGGIRIVIPAPGVTYVNLNEDPESIASTPDAIAATARGEGTGIIGLITSKGGSTGAVFDIRLLNMGKPALVEGDALFEPLSAAEADAVRNALAPLMGSVNSVLDVPGTGYCTEQDKTVPSRGDLFRFANAAKSAELAYAQRVLAGARQVEEAGLLHPDSDPTDYMHSTRQWAIWTAEKGFDKQGFTDSFLEHTREVLAANGTQWSSQIEEAVRGLIDNRWNDVRRVLEAAGIPTADDDRAVAEGGGSGSAGATLGLLLAGLVAAAISRPGARAR